VSDHNPSPDSESIVDLPAKADGDFEVFINGVPQQYGTDYHLDGRTLVFPRELAPEIRMNKLQLLRASLGIAGTYHKHDSIDISFEHSGRWFVATGLKPRPRNPEPPR
jgi:hypothetical protein